MHAAPYDPNVAYHSTGQSATPIKWTYIYNRNFGDIDKLASIASPTTDDYSQNALKKRASVPPRVLGLTEVQPYLSNGRGVNMFRFVTLVREVDPLDASWATVGGFVSSPHGTRTHPRSNLLLADGSIQTVDRRAIHPAPNVYMINGRDWAEGATNRKVTN